MRPRKPTRETVLEAGIAASLALALAAFGVVGLGRAIGGVRRSLRHRKRPPVRGSIPATRHQQIAVASPR